MTSNKEKVSSKEVGLEIGLVISRFLYKTEHLHYGFWPEDLEIIPENVQEAQDLQVTRRLPICFPVWSGRPHQPTRLGQDHSGFERRFK